MAAKNSSSKTKASKRTSKKDTEIDEEFFKELEKPENKFSRENPRYARNETDEGLVIYADECKGNFFQRRACIKKKRKEYAKTHKVKYSSQCQMLSSRKERKKCYKKLNKGF